jgi:hypothetical protein
MSTPGRALIAARAAACAWLRRQMEAVDCLHRECGSGRRRPLVTMRTATRATCQGAFSKREG